MVKANIGLLLVFIAVGLFAISSQKHSLTGQWSILNPNGTASGEYVDFKQDNTYTVVLATGKVGENRVFALKDAAFSIKNIKDVCGKDYWGKYKLTFFGNDSVHFELINHSCFARRMDIVGFNPGLKRQVTK
jgi:hypothetical protein